MKKVFKEILKGVKVAGGLSDVFEFLYEQDLYADNVYEELDSAIEIYFSYEGENKDIEESAICLHIFQNDYATQTYEEDTDFSFDDFVEACWDKDWNTVEEHTICYYIYATDKNGKELMSYKDFDITDEEFYELSDR